MSVTARCWKLQDAGPPADSAAKAGSCDRGSRAMPCTTIHAMLNSSCTARKTNLGRTQLLSHIEELLRRSASECSKYFRDLRNQQGCAVSKVILHAAPSRGVKTKKHVLWDSIRHEHPALAASAVTVLAVKTHALHSPAMLMIVYRPSFLSLAPTPGPSLGFPCYPCYPCIPCYPLNP